MKTIDLYDLTMPKIHYAVLANCRRNIIESYRAILRSKAVKVGSFEIYLDDSYGITINDTQNNRKFKISEGDLESILSGLTGIEEVTDD